MCLLSAMGAAVFVNLSVFSADQIVNRGRNIKAHYDEMNVDRYLLRIPGSWEGIQAVKQLEAEGIPCHVTLVYR